MSTRGPNPIALEGLDLDNLGAEVRKQASAKRAGNRRPEFEYAIACKRPLRSAGLHY